jgi:hypothetical protein
LRVDRLSLRQHLNELGDIAITRVLLFCRHDSAKHGIPISAINGAEECFCFWIRIERLLKVRWDFQPVL